MSSDEERKRTILLFDVDGTITPARQVISDEMDTYIQDLRKRVKVGLVGGSDLSKIASQTLPLRLHKDNLHNVEEICINRFDYVFAENGLVAYGNGKLIAKQNLATHLGEEKLQKFINFCLRYMSNLKLPVKRGNFIEFRNGLINVCPVGRSCSQEERLEFNAYDNQHKVREKFIQELEEKFGPASKEPLGLRYSIGGQISFDAFPNGWDKTFCLKFVKNDFDKIYFFGDKCSPGGNDYEITCDPLTEAYSVSDPEDTLKHLRLLKL